MGLTVIIKDRHEIKVKNIGGVEESDDLGMSLMGMMGRIQA